MATKRLTILWGLLIVALFVPRIFGTNTFHSPDEDRWTANAAGFANKLAHGHLGQLVRQPHPGITTQWLGALTIRFNNWTIKMLPIISAQIVLILLCAYLWGQLWGKSAGLLVAATLAFNPVLFAHSRNYAMDGLMTMFLVVTLGLLLLGSRRHESRYIAAAGVAAAAAILSKLPAVVILPFSVAVLLAPLLNRNGAGRRRVLHHVLLWVLFFFVGLVVILPSIAIAPVSVLGDFTELFRSDEYLVKHHFEWSYYLGSLAFFSTPAHAAALLALPLLWPWRRQWHLSRIRWSEIVVLASFALLFLLQMSIGEKKGDRYILPVFALMDVLTAALVVGLYRMSSPRSWTRAIAVALGALILLQAPLIIWAQHPHVQAYVNPLTRVWFGDRRHGWGEGLDLAASYINAQPHASELKVASYYPNEFALNFVGQTVPAHQHDNPGVDYVVVYRAMLQRGPDAWETDVVGHYRPQTPEHIVVLSGVEMAWIYKTDN